MNKKFIITLGWVTLLMVALCGCQSKSNGGSTGGNPNQSTLPSQISIDAH